jgi:hypothetical protein
VEFEMKNKRFGLKLFLIIAVLMTSLLVSSCGADEKALDSQYNNGGNINDSAEMSPDKENTLGGNGGTVEADKAVKIIKTVDITGETKDFDNTVQNIKDRVSEFNGYIEKSNVSGGQSLYDQRRREKTAELVLRIPSEKLSEFLDKTNALINVISSKESTKDVTLEYYDAESRLNTLKTKRTALEQMLEQATNLEDMLLIQDNLYDVISEIEAYQSKLNLYDNKVNYSTINLKIQEVVEYTVQKEKEPSFWERTKTTFIDSWKGFGEFWQDFAIFVVGIFPSLIIIAVFAAIITLVILKASRRNKDKNNQKKQ